MANIIVCAFMDVWFCVSDTMQWTAVELCGSVPQPRLDFASVTLHLQPFPTSSQESSHVSYSEQTGNPSVVSHTTGSSLTVSCCFLSNTGI